MTDYTKTTNFTAKDNLPVGNVNKKINGSLFDTEFDAIATAVATKANIAGPTFTGTVTAPTLAFTTATGTNLLTTAIKANDGTASATIADSTGVMTIASAVLTTADINGGSIDGTTVGATTASTGNFSTLSIGGTAITATAAELNALDGITATVTELNYTDGVTSAIQTQLDAKAPIDAATFTGTTTIPTADINGGTIDGVTIGGSSAAAGTFTTVTTSGIVSVDDTTDSTSGTTGSIHTDGGIGAVKDIVAGATLKALGDTSAGDAAAMGYTATEGLVLTGQGSTNDVTIKNDADATVISVPTGTVNTTFAGAVTLNGYTVGQWTTPSFSAGNFTASGSMTCTVASGDVQCYQYAIVDSILYLNCQLQTFTLGGTADRYVYVTIPAGISSAVGTEMTVPARVYTNGAWSVGAVNVGSGDTKVQVEKLDASNWTLGTDNNYLSFQIAIPI